MAGLPIFYIPEVTDEVDLPEDEAKHAVKVLRLQEGDEVRIVDGKGGIYKAEVTATSKKQCSLRVLDSKQEFGKRDLHLTIAVAPTKNNSRFEWFLEKATEMGIETIIPIVSDHSEKAKIKPDRFNKILIAAMKQSGKAYLPTLTEVRQFDEVVENPPSGQLFIAHCRKMPERKQLKDVYEKGRDATVLVGPEGDFSKEEIQRAVDAGYRSISLGRGVLRTETAAIVACHTLNLLND